MPATPKQRLRSILKAGNYRLAYKTAQEIAPIDLLEAMHLTLLAAEEDRDHFEALAVP